MRSIERENNQNDLINNYNYDLINRDSYYTYEDDNYYSSFGIDISEHQEEVDFKKVKEAGVEFVYIRLGFRGSTQGLLYIDDKFEEYYEKAKAQNLKIGFYFFSQATSEQEAIEEAEFVLKNIQNKSFDLPIVYDYEDLSGGSRIDNLSKEDRTNIAISFLERIRKNGHHTMLYLNMYWYNTYYDFEQLSNYDIWFAQYNSYPEFPHHFKIWQYSEEGRLDGIENPVDLNIMFIKKDS